MLKQMPGAFIDGIEPGTIEEVAMIAKTMLSILAVIGLAVLAYPSQDAKAQLPTEQKSGFASSEKQKTEVSRRRSQKTRPHYRHRGGRHPHFGGRY